MREQNDDCYLCDGSGEIETTDRNNKRETVPCPECIAREVAEERQETAKQIAGLEKDAARFGAFATMFIVTAQGGASELVEAMADYLERHHPENNPPISVDDVRAAIDAALSQVDE